MPKVLYVIDSLQTGGAEKSLLDIASRLKVFEPVVCHIYTNDLLKTDFERNGIRVISLGVKGQYGFREAYLKLKHVVLTEKPDLVVATLLRSELVSRMVCRACRVLNIGTFVNDTYSRYEWQALSLSMKMKVGFFWILNAFTARYCHGFLSNSESIKKSNCKALGIDPSRVEVIYRGRKPDVFSFSGDRFKSTTVSFLAVGRLLHRKGFEELLRAFDTLRKKNTPVTLAVAGEGPYRQRLENLISELGLHASVKLLGDARNVPELMRIHDVFVFPSHYEGFSGTIVEAMFSGIPILASDIDMNKEALVHNSTARLFPVKNESRLAEEMIWMCAHPEEANELARKARREAEARFDIARIAAQHDAFYQRVTQSRP